MNREIKFRAWNCNDSTMYHNVGMMPYEGGYRIYNSDHVGEVILDMYGSNPQLMQYTGLKDKNGVEVYEGDIVAIDMWQDNEHGYMPEYGVIKWYEAAFKWFSGDPSDSNNYWLSQADAKQRKVIGNIHDNPELLKEVES